MGWFAPQNEYFKNKGGTFKFTADFDKCANLSWTILFSKEVNSVARGSILLPRRTRQSSRLLVMFPLPWCHTSPWFTLSEKIFTLSPFIDFMYKVREPAEVHQFISFFFFRGAGVALVLCVPDSQACLTWIDSSHLIPEMDTLCLSTSSLNRGGKESTRPSRKEVCSGVRHHVETCKTKLSLSFPQCAFNYQSFFKGTSYRITLFSLQCVVNFWSTGRAGESTSMKPVNFAKAVVPTLLAFKGTHPWHSARMLCEGYIVNGDAPVKTRSNRFEYQLNEG